MINIDKNSKGSTISFDESNAKLKLEKPDTQ